MVLVTVSNTVKCNSVKLFYNINGTNSLTVLQNDLNYLAKHFRSQQEDFELVLNLKSCTLLYFISLLEM